jgi:hypothetical protein
MAPATLNGIEFAVELRQEDHSEATSLALCFENGFDSPEVRLIPKDATGAASCCTISTFEVRTLCPQRCSVYPTLSKNTVHAFDSELRNARRGQILALARSLRSSNLDFDLPLAMARSHSIP